MAHLVAIVHIKQHLAQAAQRHWQGGLGQRSRVGGACRPGASASCGGSKAAVGWGSDVRIAPRH